MGKILIIKGATYTPPSSGGSSSDDNNNGSGSGSTSGGNTGGGTSGGNTGGGTSGGNTGGSTQSYNLPDGMYLYFYDATAEVYYASRSAAASIGAVVLICEAVADIPYTSVTIDTSVTAKLVTLFPGNARNYDFLDPADAVPASSTSWNPNGAQNVENGAGGTLTIDKSYFSFAIFIGNAWIGSEALSSAQVDTFIEEAQTKITFS